jgi:hypothetical protein
MERSAAHVVRILDQSGDTTLTYDPSDPAGVDEIERRFARLMERNFVAFDVSTTPGRIITTFDPAATEIIVSPRFAGG